ncbi:MAG: 2-dehydropantoate 2-reductase [Rhodobacteraceae bacterium]|nr:2-dehydropantoate 2-reductase [Paracoccaceae bacterium]
MRIAVLGGGGAMGGLFGGYLARGGNDVTLIDVSTEAVAAIRAAGVSIEEKDGSQPVIPVAASSDPAEVGPVDLIVTFVKCYHTEAAVRSAAPMIGPDTAVLSLQNGWGNAPRIAAVVGEDRVIVGLTYHSGTLLGPGRVKHPGAGITYLGELSGRRTERIERVADAFQRSGIETTVSDQILGEVWKKLALNACTLPTSALLGFFAHELVAFDASKRLMAAILTEVVAVANAQGIALDYDERWPAITGLLERAVGGKASMLQDFEARRPTEIAVINGAIVDAGRRTGVPTPINETMVWMVEAAERRFLQAKP